MTFHCHCPIQYHSLIDYECVTDSNKNYGSRRIKKQQQKFNSYWVTGYVTACIQYSSVDNDKGTENIS